MNDKFDELAKNMAQSVTRRGALKKFGFGPDGIALASVELANQARAGKPRCELWFDQDKSNLPPAGRAASISVWLSKRAEQF